MRGPLLTEAAEQLILCGFSHDPHSTLAGSSRICTCLKCLSNCRCMVLIAASGFLANPGPPNVKYVSQLEHLPCSPDWSFWVISRCGFFMHQVSHSQDSRTSPVDFKLHHYHFWPRSSDGPSLTMYAWWKPRPHPATSPAPGSGRLTQVMECRCAVSKDNAECSQHKTHSQGRPRYNVVPSRFLVCLRFLCATCVLGIEAFSKHLQCASRAGPEALRFGSFRNRGGLREPTHLQQTGALRHQAGRLKFQPGGRNDVQTGISTSRRKRVE